MAAVGSEDRRKAEVALLGAVRSGTDAGRSLTTFPPRSVENTRFTPRSVPPKVLNFGRPASFVLSTIDCKFPADSTQFAFPNDELDPPFHSTKYRYFSIYLTQVIDVILGTKATTYATILALDRKLRDQEIAPLKEFDTSRGPGEPIVDLTGSSLGVTMQKFMLVAWPHLSTHTPTQLYTHMRVDELLPLLSCSAVVSAPWLFCACAKRAPARPGAAGGSLRALGVGHIPELVRDDCNATSRGARQR